MPPSAFDILSNTLRRLVGTLINMGRVLDRRKRIKLINFGGPPELRESNATFMGDSTPWSDWKSCPKPAMPMTSRL